MVRSGMASPFPAAPSTGMRGRRAALSPLARGERIVVTGLAVLSYRFFETPARRFMIQPGAFWPLTARRALARQPAR